MAQAKRAGTLGRSVLAQVVIRRSTIDLPGLPRSLRDNHARFLREWREVLVTYGPIFRGDAPAGYLYQLDLPGTVPEATARFLAEDPLAVNGVVESDEISDWHCALATRQPVLLLDEPTSGLDPDAQREVLEAIARLRGKRTVVMVTHRAEPLAVADRVISVGGDISVT